MPPQKRKPSSTNNAKSNETSEKPKVETSNSAQDSSSGMPSDFTSFTISSTKGKSIPCESRGTDSNAQAKLIFTHGAGGGLEAPATKLFAEGVASTGEMPVLSFQGPMNLKSRIVNFLTVIDYVADGGNSSPALGGRSMGSRAAVLASQEHVASKDLVLVSYPLVSPAGDVRDQILIDLPDDKNVLFLIGDRDSMCDLKHLNQVREKMKATTWLVVVETADHGMSISSKKGIDLMRRRTGALAAEWLKDHGSIPKESTLRWNPSADNVIHADASDGSQQTGLTSWLRRGGAQEKHEAEAAGSKKRMKKE